MNATRSETAYRRCRRPDVVPDVASLTTGSCPSLVHVQSVRSDTASILAASRGVTSKGETGDTSGWASVIVRGLFTLHLAASVAR